MSDQNDHLNRLIDGKALSEFLSERLGFEDELDIEYHDKGYSNEVLFFDWDGQGYALRRPPAGETPASAHNVLREHEVISALAETSVPVPETVVVCDDDSIIGSDFFVMKRLDGTVIHNDTGEPDRFGTPAHRERIGSEMVTTLVTIHDVDYERVGLGEYGDPEAYLSKQVGLWTHQMEESFSRSGREVDALRAASEWLDDSIPEPSDTTLVHGDYKLDNVMFGPGTPPEIVGVFDWEMSTLGDPLADVGYMLFNWTHGSEESSVPELFPRFTPKPGYPSQQELVQMYEETSGRTYRHDRFYRALGGFKLATALEAFYARYLDGTATDPMFPLLEDGVPELAARVQRIIDGEEPLN